MSSLFSSRHRYGACREIVVREGAPDEVRAGLLGIASRVGLNYCDLREIICPVLHVFPDPNNWSEIPNVRDEVIELIQGCEWYRVYDICEAIYHSVRDHESPGYFLSKTPRRSETYAEELNQLFQEHGIGWQFVEGQIITRGPEEFERTVGEATAALTAAGLQAPKQELEEARRDLSRRPQPDLTGTIQHCMAALECTARIVSADETATLGEIVRRHAMKIGIPRPLDAAIEKMWGYASETARHIREGDVPERKEAELLLNVSAALVNYLLQK